jgi:7-cyano-7-deazaguanine synthase in queuosine biosynthesis
MNNIICDHRFRPEWRRLRPKAPLVWLSSNSHEGNVYLEPLRLEESLGVALDPLSLDLCEVAAYVYLADKAVPRGRYEKWVRDLSFFIPVRAPGRWNAVRSLLTNTVGTLSGDNVQFHFVEKHEPRRSRQQIGTPQPRPPQEAADCVALFSGGLDSLAGAVYLAQEGRRPLLASHYVSGLKSVQRDLAQALGLELGRTFEHFQYRVSSCQRAHTRHPLTTRESTHRARSFLFLSFAASAAAVRGLSEIFICENGVLSLNVPISDARKGTRSTHHAHPLYLSYFNDLINALFERPFAVHNPFFYWTKREEVELLRRAGLHGLIRETVSCWGYPNLTMRFPDSNHCGTCIPCLVRRVSMIAAGLEAYDDRYVANAFDAGASLPPKKRRNVEDLVYFAERFVRSSKSDLLRLFPELVMVELGPDGFRGSRLDAMIGVYRRFAMDVLAIAADRAPELLSERRQAA